LEVEAMSSALSLGRFSIGVGDRFAHQAAAQLRACVAALEAGVVVTPVWNKSHREHLIVGSEPSSVREAAEAAVRQAGWKGAFHVDADHIGLATVDRFIDSCDFFTLDVAESIGSPAGAALAGDFIARHPELAGRHGLPGLEAPVEMSLGQVHAAAVKYLAAVREAGAIHRHIEAVKGAGTFITEVSMDETGTPQTPPELLVILAAIADERIPAQTIAPKFSGRFNKGVDYVGEAGQFESEFAAGVAVVGYAAQVYGLPGNLKLSVHSGSDKFSLYPAIRRCLERTGAGVHLKTAGTTWLEELIGLAEGGGEGLETAKEIYRTAWSRREEFEKPYASVIAIDPARLPDPAEVGAWTGERFAAALRHEPSRREFNPDLRQLLHVGYKAAAEMGGRYLSLLREYADIIGKNVTLNLLERHIRPLFLEPEPRA
jgi:hypothetical protein